jgi:EAL domain-containing protein (putative c-di-GMP-specific phosphodiesterase class I)
MATQVMTDTAPRGVRGTSARDQIASLRRLRETLLHQAFDLRLRPIMRLETNDIFGYLESAGRNKEALGFPGGVDLDIQCRVARSFRQLVRATAVDQFLTLDQAGYLFLHMGRTELEHGQELRSHLTRLASRVPSSMTLVAQFPAAVADEMPKQQELCSALHDMNIQLAYGDAVISSQQLLSFEGTHPSFIVLSPRMISDVIRHRHQQRQLAGLLTTCDEIGCQAIADGVTTPDHKLCCQELGFRFGLCDTAHAI